MTGHAAHEDQPGSHGDEGGEAPRRAWSTRRRVLLAGVTGAGLVAAALVLTPGLRAGQPGTAAPSAVTATPAAPGTSAPGTPTPSTTVTAPVTPAVTAGPAAPAPLPPLEQRWLDDGAITSDSPQAGDVLQDGAFVADVQSVDTVARTITADIVIFYGGDDAWAAAREREPDTADQVVNNGYYVVNDVERTRVLGVTPDVRVGGACFDDVGLTTVELTFAEWAAETEPGESLACGDRGWPLPGLYWLDVRSGRVAQITEQWVP